MEKNQKKFIQIKQDATIQEAIQILHQKSIDFLQMEGCNFTITRHDLICFYEKGVPLDTTILNAKNNHVPETISNETLLAIIENLPVSLYVTDEKGKTILANERFIQSTGITRNELLKKDVYSMVQKGIYSPAITPIVLTEKRIVSINQQLKDNSETVVTGIPVMDANHEIQLVITVSQNNSTKNLTETKSEIGLVKDNIIYKSDVMHEIVQTACQVASVDSAILITGESGVGKDVIANLIHSESERANESFIQLNCGAISEQLLESELFGYEPGTFTGGNPKGKRGLIEAANKGTLFLDEVGEMPISLQVKLLQVLQNKQIVRMGSTTPIDVDIRIISATNRNLQQDIKEGLFRLDLYYRLNVIPLYIPPLRERKEDIIPLAYYFLERFNYKNKKKVILTFDIEQLLLNSKWPGNIRELRNFIERLVVIDGNNERTSNHQLMNHTSKPIEVHEIMPLKQAIEFLEKQLINKAVQVENNSYTVADLLKISQSTAHRKMQKYM